jgi:glycosyltransferase involved in cell wall biosynthesis
MRRPVVATRLPLVERTFDDGTVVLYPAGDASAFADGVEHLIDRPDEREERVARTRTRVVELAWERTVAGYLEIIEAMAADGLSSAAEGPADPAGTTPPGLEDA